MKNGIFTNHHTSSTVDFIGYFSLPVIPRHPTFPRIWGNSIQRQYPKLPFPKHYQKSVSKKFPVRVPVLVVRLANRRPSRMPTTRTLTPINDWSCQFCYQPCAPSPSHRTGFKTAPPGQIAREWVSLVDDQPGRESSFKLEIPSPCCPPKRLTRNQFYRIKRSQNWMRSRF